MQGYQNKTTNNIRLGIQYSWTKSFLLRRINMLYIIMEKEKFRMRFGFVISMKHIYMLLRILVAAWVQVAEQAHSLVV